MPSPRQIRTLVVGVMIGVVFVLVYTSKLRHEQADGRSLQDFYHRTVNGMDNNNNNNNGNGAAANPPSTGKKPPTPVNPRAQGMHVAKDKDGDGHIDEDDERMAKEMAERLREAEIRAKEAANKKALKPNPPSEVVGVGNSAKHQDRPRIRMDGEDVEEEDEDKEEEDNEETRMLHKVEAEINTILAKAPIIIFSKTYCPFSKRAKGILLDKYEIDPAPYIVELDEIELGSQIQEYLGSKTGRYTVPNILINSVGIGGADDINELDKRHKLEDKVAQLGQGKVKATKRLAQ